MQTVIGRGFRGGRAGMVSVVGLLAIGADLWLVWLNRYPESLDGRWAIALATLAAIVWLSGGDLPTVGLCSPTGGWRRWVRIAVLLGLMAASIIAAAAWVWVLAGWQLPIQTTPPDQIGSALSRMCVLAPLLEESLYRVVLCVCLVSAIGPKGAVVVSGALFGLLHAVYGNPSPENLLGGFFLAWAYLRSGSVVVPVALHSAGNLVILVGQVGAWYWQMGFSFP